MKKIEKVLWGLFILGLIFKLNHWPFAGILTVLSLGLVASFYFYFGFGLFNNIKLKHLLKKENYSSIPKPNIAFGFLFGISLSLIIFGFLFKFMIWPNANFILITGIIFLLVCLAFYFVLLSQKKVSIPKNSFIRILVVGLLGLSIYLIQTDSIIDFYYPNDKPFAEALKNIVKDPSNVEYQEVFVKIRDERIKLNTEEQGK
ncbi:hypothetical protein N9P38_00375 [Flavobacteriales bacterium]|nr:hypothetical protein [Flavobacteriales bacterium]MDB4088737.1 hypothetical protein [Flavobacteriales bacterium]